jgi:hypothetical protein
MANLENVNIFLRAQTPLELVALQAANNAINGMQYAYQTPVWTGKDWVIWFFADIKEWNDPASATKEAIKLAREINK